MYRSLFLFLAFLAMFVGGAIVPSYAADEKTHGKTIIISSDLWCPVACAPDDARPGLAVDLIKEIFEPRGYKIIYKVMPWQRAIEEVELGNIDAILATNKNEAPNLIFPKYLFIKTTTDMYVLTESSIKSGQVNDIETIRLGAIQGYDYAKTFNDYLEKYKNNSNKVQFVAGEDALQQNIRKLLAGRIDAFIDSRLVVDYMLDDMHLDKRIRRVEPSLPMADLYIAFSPAIAEAHHLNSIYTAGIEKLKKTGKINEIYAKYQVNVP